MGKVLCINDSGWYENRKWIWGLIKRQVDSTGPEYGDICTIVGGYWEDGIYFYELLEWPPNNGDCGFESSCFIPLSNLDETEIHKETLLQTIK